MNKHLFSILPLVLLLSLLCLNSSFAQVHINDKLDVGVGTNSITNTKLTVLADSLYHEKGLEVVSNRAGDRDDPAIRAGIHNLVEGGFDKKSGIHNEVNQVDISSDRTLGYTVGINNEVENKSAGHTYGIYSTVSGNNSNYTQTVAGIYSKVNGPGGNAIITEIKGGGLNRINGSLNFVTDFTSGDPEGDKVGVFNQVSRSKPTSPPTIGQFGQTLTYATYGAYSYVTSLNSGTKYGTYNIVDNKSTNVDNTSDHYGTYNYHFVRQGSPNVYGTYNDIKIVPGTYNGQQYAVYGKISNYASSTLAYGIYGSAPTNNVNSLAGYFNGNVKVTGTLTEMSDERLKTNIESVTNALDIIAKIQPKSYEFDNKIDESVHLPKGKQYGFLAQDLEEVLPNLVEDLLHGGQTKEVPTSVELMEEDAEGKLSLNKQKPTDSFRAETVTEVAEYKSINYIALIPILVQGMKEQQAKIEQLEQQIETLTTAAEKK